MVGRIKGKFTNIPIPMTLAIQRIDTADPAAAAQIQALRRKLSPEGEFVSEAGRQKTIDVFGEPLTPVQAVERICGQIRERGLADRKSVV